MEPKVDGAMRARSLCAAVALLLAACGRWRLQPGLSNVPAANRPWGDDDLAHDFVSNGDESCPSAAGGPEKDHCFYSSRKVPMVRGGRP